MTQPLPPQLTINRPSTSAIVIALDLPHYLPAWESLKILVAECAFLGRDLCLATVASPIWDVELAALSSDVRHIQPAANRDKIALAVCPAASAQVLDMAVESTDFTLRSLRIVVLPADDAERMNAFAAALAEQLPLEQVDTQEEYMECIDEQWIYWVNPNEERSRACIDTLSKLASENGWNLAV